jgi:hypothetical protein
VPGRKHEANDMSVTAVHFAWNGLRLSKCRAAPGTACLPQGSGAAKVSAGDSQIATFITGGYSRDKRWSYSYRIQLADFLFSSLFAAYRQSLEVGSIE